MGYWKALFLICNEVSNVCAFPQGDSGNHPGAFLSLALNSADAMEEAELNTRAYAPLPQDAAIWAEPLDDSDFNLSVQHSFAEALKQSSMAGGSAAARLNLTFETFDQFTSGARESLGEVLIDTTSASSLRLNMWSSNRNSLFNRHADQSSDGRFLIAAILYDTETRRRPWEAEASAPAGARYDKSRIADLVYMMVAELGKTARKDALALD